MITERTVLSSGGSGLAEDAHSFDSDAPMGVIVSVRNPTETIDAPIEKWPRAIRVLFLVGAAVGSWALIVFGARLI